MVIVSPFSIPFHGIQNVFLELNEDELRLESRINFTRRAAYLPLPVALEKGGSMRSIETYTRTRTRTRMFGSEFDSFKHHAHAGIVHGCRRVRFSLK